MASHVHYQKGKLQLAQSALGRALAIQHRISPRLYQIDTTMRLYESDTGALSARSANDLYELLLSDPKPEDWLFRPLDTMGFIMDASQAPYESWFNITLARGESQKALEIGDAMRRRHFYSNLPLGGRLLSLRWLLEADEFVLSDQSKERRADILTRYPAFKELSESVKSLRAQLAKLPIDELSEEQTETQKELSAEINHLSMQQEAILGAIALRREFCPFVFPPLRTTTEIQSALGPKQVALVFVATSSNIHAFMLSTDKYANWMVEAPVRLRKDLTRLFSAYGLTGENGRVTRDQLENEKRDELGEKVLRSLVRPAQHGFWNKFDEIVIVPDNLLWYVPFEALPIPDPDHEGHLIPLISKIRVRYLPMASMLNFKGAPAARNPKTAVVLGKLFPRDNEVLAGEQLEAMQEVANNLHPLPKRLGEIRGC